MPQVLPLTSFPDPGMSVFSSIEAGEKDPRRSVSLSPSTVYIRSTNLES